MALALHRSLVKPLEPSSWAAAALGPNTAMPAARNASATPATSGASGPTTTRSIARAWASSTTAAASHGSIATHSAQRAMPGLPGAAINSSQLGDCLSRQRSASSRPPDPNSRIFMDLPDEPRAGLLANVAAGDNSPPLTVSELSGALKRTIESAFGKVRVRGEISGFKRHCSGHCYFTLKDENACIDAVIWRDQRGRAGVPARRWRRGHRHRQAHHLSRPVEISDRRRPDGAGRRGRAAGLARAAAQGARRRGAVRGGAQAQLPFLPRIIGVVTSPTGAVIRDILHRLEDRCPTHVILWPVAVQGEGAAAGIARAIRGFPTIEPRPDLLIVARGGGSIEDLWAFNEEEVVRAAAELPIPLISAVGHETDTTLIDFAADRRAPTPTAAAEMAVPVRAELFAQLDELRHRARHCLSRRADRSRERFELRLPLARTAGYLRSHGAAPRRSASGCRARSPPVRARPRRPQPGCRPAAPRTPRPAHRPARPSDCRRRGGWPSSPIPNKPLRARLRAGHHPRRPDLDSRARRARGESADAALRRRRRSTPPSTAPARRRRG